MLHGDRRCAAIAAASIVAKVSRDRQMMTEHNNDPRYGYDEHKGYATAEHRAAVETVRILVTASPLLQAPGEPV